MTAPGAPMTSMSPDQKHLGRGVVVSGLVAASGYFAFSIWAGWRDVLAALGAIGLFGMIAALSLSLVNYALRFIRWQGYLRALGHPMPPGPSAAIYLSGFAFTTTPGKAGELLRGIFLVNHGMPMMRAAAAFLSERLSDLVAVVLIALPGLAVLPRGLPVVVMGVLAIGALGLTMGFGDRLNHLASGLGAGRGGFLRSSARKIALLLYEARRCHAPGATLTATLLSILAWSAEATAFYLVLRWLGIDPGLWYAMSVYAMAMLAGALSFLPGGLGGTEAVMVAMLIFKGAPEPQAVAATIVIRLTTLWFAVALGLITVLAGQKLLHPQQRATAP
jgi:uncharacterized membrane protein YbhN (UPF0104 family)